jgi:enoyl-CoA hydratase/carnithine racemase
MGEDADGGTPPLLARDGNGAATLTLNRPRHLNRLHREDLAVLRDHIAALAADDSLRVLVLTGAGRAFCAGFNLQELAQADAGGTDPRLFEHTVDALEALPVPTIARLNGGVFGGATDLALACDFRVGVQGMELRMPAARIGLHYYASGLSRYVSRLGLRAAKRLFLLAETLPADELLRIGYLDALVPPEQLDAAVQAMAAPLRSHAPLALRGMKCSLNELAHGTAQEAVLRQREDLCAASLDLQEGLAALAQKRPAQFSGR